MSNMARPCMKRSFLVVSLESRSLGAIHTQAVEYPDGLKTCGYNFWNMQTVTRIHQRRRAHTRRHVSSAAISMPLKEYDTPIETMSPPKSALSILPLSTLLRSYVITAVSSIPLLLKPSLAMMSFLAHSKARFLNPDHNPVLHALLKKTFYVQFCAGETPDEVHRTIDQLKTLGYKGVILGHAREVVLSKEEAASLDASQDCAEQAECNTREVTQWKKATLDTIDLAQKGDFVALKFTGAGRQALQHLKQTIPCAPLMRDAIHEICQLAQKRQVSLLFDAEQASLQDGIDNWTMYYMQHYNKGEKATVYGTYQAYAKRTPGVLAQHLDQAQKNEFVLGIKLVRGAYLGSDPRDLFWDTIEDTHRCYDNIAECVMQRQYTGLVQPAEGASAEFPRANLVLASHNAESVQKARTLRDQQAKTGAELVPMAYGQLMGMADHVSCELVKEAKERSTSGWTDRDVPQAYKYLVWGTMGECMKYLLRRAQENKDAVSRTIDARKSLGKELARRVGFSRESLS